MVTSWKKGKKSNCRDRKQRSQEQWSVRLFIVDDEWKFDLDNKIKKKKLYQVHDGMNWVCWLIQIIDDAE